MNSNLMKMLGAAVGALLLTATQNAFSGTVTVEKVSGSKAIVKFDGMRPKTGETYDIGGGGGGGGGAGSRQMYLGLDASLSKDMDVGGFPISLDAEPGWNFGQFEVGVPLTFRMTPNVIVNGTSVTQTAFGASIHPQFNFMPNTPGTQTVVDVHALVGMIHDNVLGTSIPFGGGLGVKAFVFGNDQVALSAAIDFTMTHTSAGTGKAISVPVGIRAYF